MSGLLLALWIASIGADRIDFLGGHGSFRFTPFILMTPIVGIAELLRRARLQRPLQISSSVLGYAAVVSALITVAFVSVFGAQELPESAARAALLLSQVLGTFAIAVLARDRDDFLLLLARGALACLVVYVLFDVAEALWWIGRWPPTMRFGPAIVHFDSLQNAGPIPRLAGPVADGNRGGFVLLFYIAAIARGERRVWLRRAGITLAVLLLAATISRSATLGAVAALGMALWTGRVRVTRRVLAVASLLATAAVAAVLVRPTLLDDVAAMEYSPLAERVSPDVGSARAHVAVIERGLENATESVRRASIGLGYGNAYVVLQDIFPGNKYGNFHSLYVTMFAECGIVALVLTLVLLAGPLVFGGPWREVIAGAVAFNLFYQTTSEPTFWFVLALAWFGMTWRASGQLVYLQRDFLGGPVRRMDVVDVERASTGG
ncbi:MAG TPA: O-antigen ligase family protein [Gemmatimonadaceae bacterium]|nr:O-antigen ligase family protein [Gemmatimonadaceae bacterium]